MMHDNNYNCLNCFDPDNHKPLLFSNLLFLLLISFSIRLCMGMLYSSVCLRLTQANY